jgi:hypothetical protein
MSALGQKRTLRLVRLMSALPPKADMVLHQLEGSTVKWSRAGNVQACYHCERPMTTLQYVMVTR